MRAKLRVKTGAPKASFIRDERGHRITEYALLIAMLALGIEAGISPVACAITIALSKIASTLGAYTG